MEEEVEKDEGVVVRQVRVKHKDGRNDRRRWGGRGGRFYSTSG